MSEQETGQVAPVVDNEAQNPAAATATAETQGADTQAAAQEESTAVEKTYSKAELQELIEKATAKAAAKAERRAYREAIDALRPAQPTHQQQTEPVARRENESEAQYVKRLVDQGIAERDNAGSKRQLADKTERMYAEAAKLPGFDREEFNDLLASHPFSAEFSHALIDSDQGAQLMAYMTAHPEEAARIGALSPARQAAEIGRLESKATAAPKVSTAPPPIKPIGSRGSGQTGDYASMTVEQMEADMKKRGSKWVR